MLGAARRLLAASRALLVLIPTACTWDLTEPGVFRTRAPAAPFTQPSRGLQERTNPTFIDVAFAFVGPLFTSR